MDSIAVSYLVQVGFGTLRNFNQQQADSLAKEKIDFGSGERARFIRDVNGDHLSERDLRLDTLLCGDLRLNAHFARWFDALVRKVSDRGISSENANDLLVLFHALFDPKEKLAANKNTILTSAKKWLANLICDQSGKKMSRGRRTVLVELVRASNRWLNYIAHKGEHNCQDKLWTAERGHKLKSRAGFTAEQLITRLTEELGIKVL